mgnify:CR=1 FL=1
MNIQRKNRRLLIQVMLEHKDFSVREIRHVLKRVNPEWLSVFHSIDDVRTQFGVEYMLWRGLGSALFNYLAMVERMEKGA